MKEARHISYDSTYVKLWKRPTVARESSQWFLGAGAWKKGLIRRGHEGALCGDENVLYLACGGS